MEPAALQELLGRVLVGAGVAPVIGETPPTGVEVVRRRGSDHDYLFVFNHSAPPVEVLGAGHDLLSATDTGAGLHLGTGAVAIIREATGSSWTVRVLES